MISHLALHQNHLLTDATQGALIEQLRKEVLGRDDEIDRLEGSIRLLNAQVMDLQSHADTAVNNLQTENMTKVCVG